MAQRGRLAFTDPKDLERRIERYFDGLWQERIIYHKDGTETREPFMRPPTMAGLALALGTTRQTLLNYSTGAGERDASFVPIIERAKMRIAEFAEEALYTREASTGAQFALRVNHGYGATETASGDAFEMKVIPPSQGEAVAAIPKWTEDDAAD